MENKGNRDDTELRTPATILRTPRFIESSKPLQDDERLLHGPRITYEENIDTSNLLRKSASNQAPGIFRWESEKIATGLSRTSLRITGPSARHRENISARDQLTGNLLTGPIFQDKSILYTYSSSFSNGLQISGNFGAVGDHLNSDEQTSIRNQSPQDNPKVLRERASWDSSNVRLTHLHALIENSTPDEQTYNLLVLSEIGPLSQPLQPRIAKADQLSLTPRRRRSCNDMIERPFRAKGPKNVGMRESQGPLETCHKLRAGRRRHKEIDVIGQIEPEVWQRQGPSYRATLHLAQGHSIDQKNMSDDLDPLTFSLPQGVSFQSLYVKRIRAYSWLVACIYDEIGKRDVSQAFCERGSLVK